MEQVIVLLLAISSCVCSTQLLLVASSADAEITKRDITWWCSTTPHPATCSRFLAGFSPNSIHDFRTLTIQAALNRSISARDGSGRAASRCRSKRKAVIYRDCNSLIDGTILQLNTILRGIRRNSSFTDFDAQTWLSTALTNIEICRSSSRDLHVAKFDSPILSRNVFELISNCLATNGKLLGGKNKNGSSAATTTTSYKGFPGWVTSRDRKLIQDLALASAAANAVVAQDGTGNFRSIQAAIDYAVGRRVGNERVVVYVKRGVYRENVLITRTMNKVMLVGDGIRSTIITGSRSVAAGFTTYSSATVGVDGIGFIARGITFRNEAGPQGGQAVALRSASDLSVFYACAFEGYQDTLFVHAQRQFYKYCYIYGTIDFIFGNAAVVFQNCMILVRRPLVGQANVVTAQGRGDPFQNTGISIHRCRIEAAPDLRPVVGSVETYLGRPWQQYSRTVIMKTYLDSLISPQGWLRWHDSDFALTTLYYGEYRNTGPGRSTRNRVGWPGYHAITSPNVASPFTVEGLIAGRAWLPSTGVPFTAGL